MKRKQISNDTSELPTRDRSRIHALRQIKSETDGLANYGILHDLLLYPLLKLVTPSSGVVYDHCMERLRDPTFVITVPKRCVFDALAFDVIPNQSLLSILFRRVPRHAENLRYQYRPGHSEYSYTDDSQEDTKQVIALMELIVQRDPHHRLVHSDKEGMLMEWLISERDRSRIYLVPHLIRWYPELCTVPESIHGLFSTAYGRGLRPVVEALITTDASHLSIIDLFYAMTVMVGAYDVLRFQQCLDKLDGIYDYVGCVAGVPELYATLVKDRANKMGNKQLNQLMSNSLYAHEIRSERSRHVALIETLVNDLPLDLIDSMANYLYTSEHSRRSYPTLQLTSIVYD